MFESNVFYIPLKNLSKCQYLKGFCIFDSLWAKSYDQKKINNQIFQVPFSTSTLQKLSNDIINIWFEQSLSLAFSCQTFGNLFFMGNCSLVQFNPLLLWGKANLVLSDSISPWGKGDSILPRGRKQFRPLRQLPFPFVWFSAFLLKENVQLNPLSLRKRRLHSSLDQNAT